MHFDESASDARSRILAATSRLIREGGGAAATTRAVAAAAGVQAPTIYRFFADKRSLLAAAAAYELSRYVAGKEDREPHPDSIEDLRRGWDEHVAFCLANPDLFAILNQEADAADGPSAGRRGMEVLSRKIGRVAEAGRLTTTQDRALAFMHAAGTGTILTLLRQPEADRDGGLSAFTRDMVIAAITRPADAAQAEPERHAHAAAAQLRTALDGIAVLSAGERHLLAELLDRIALAAQ